MPTDFRHLQNWSAIGGGSWPEGRLVTLKDRLALGPGRDLVWQLQTMSAFGRNVTGDHTSRPAAS